jgi:hypothetical protein
MHQLNVTLGEHIWNDVRRFHEEFHEFIMHISADMNISSFLFLFYFFTLEE